MTGFSDQAVAYGVEPPAPVRRELFATALAPWPADGGQVAGGAGESIAATCPSPDGGGAR